MLPAPLLGVYLNPDDIEAGIRQCGYLDLAAFGVDTTADALLPAFTASPLLRSADLEEPATQLRFSDRRLDFAGVEVNAYFASVAVDVLRRHLLERWVSFTFESVMSHPGKVELLAQVQ